MSATWVVVGAVGAATVVVKAAGPVLLARRPLSPRVLGLVEMLAPVMLAALVVTQTVGGDRAIVLDERLAGIAAAVVVIALRAPLLAVVVAGGAATALARLLV